jgi:ribosome-binding ATPase YchF (GTP1/OBG family)
VDVIVQVLRHFADTDVSHVEGTVDPMRDVEIINTELIIADLELIDKNLAGMTKKASVTKDPLLTRTVSALTTVAQALRV